MTTPDAGLREIAARFAAQGDVRFGPAAALHVAASRGHGHEDEDPAADGSDGATLAAVLKSQGQPHASKQLLAALTVELRYVNFPPLAGAVAGGVLSLTSNEWTPKTGFFAAIQRISAIGLGAGDIFVIYKGGAGTAGQQPANAIGPQQGGSLTFASPTWLPGKSGLILHNGDYLSGAGTGLTGTNITINCDMILGLETSLSDYLA
jgi:hypothetical protein